MKTVLDTSALAPADRREFWVEEVIRGLDSNWRIDFGGADPRRFAARLESIPGADGVMFSRFQTDPQRLSRLSELQADEDDNFMLMSGRQFGGIVHINGEERYCPPNRWMLIDKRFPVSMVSAKWSRDIKLGVYVPRRKLNALLGRPLQITAPWVVPDTLGTPAGLLCDTLNSAFTQLFNMAAPIHVSPLLAEQVCNLLSLAITDQPDQATLARAQIDEALRYMERRHTDRGLSAASVASAFGISKSLLYARFAECGLRFSLELRRIRCERAAQILRDRDRRHWNIEAVAQAVGFSGSTALIRVFRDHYTETPARYRSRYS
ncbi:MAG TPA: AraC family transcriptional regulator [Gammaproteobacteria bacterium]|nr:AraC family transcriptional regulator [Gammaproteobacteria bacterium]